MTFTKSEEQELVGALRRAAPIFGPKLAELAFQRGLAVTDKTSGEQRAIPVTATPVIIEEFELRRRQRLAARLSSATLKMSRAVLAGPLKALVTDALSPLEKSLAEATFAHVSTLVTTRVDFFAEQKVSALEVNATIPAMQGYSDIAANSFLQTVGETWKLPQPAIERLQRENGSNAAALQSALLAGYRQVRPGATPDRIMLLCRRNDAQLTEQHYLAAWFSANGLPADVVHPDELSGEDRVLARGKAYDLIYRHLFVRRLEEEALRGADYVKALLFEKNGTRAVVLNPPASQVEVKAVFALLSSATEDAALAKTAGLSTDELAAIAECVPWTRPFRREALCAQVAAAPERYVLKRSWDYGGRAVFVGKSKDSASFGDRVRAAFGSKLSWNELCARAVVDPVGGGFVVQELVDIQPESHLLCDGKDQKTTSLFVDFSTYASVGLDDQPEWGGVCRGSISQIVNIVGGGGVLPLLTAEVARSLLVAHRESVKVIA
jgi:hypothetical protein